MFIWETSGYRLVGATQSPIIIMMVGLRDNIFKKVVIFVLLVQST